MVGDLLGGLDRAIVTPESAFKGDVARIFAAYGVEAAISHLQNSFRFALWNTKIDKAYLSGSETASDFLWRLVELYARAHGLPEPEAWIDHTPGNLANWSKLADVCPNPCFIHVVRDGRAVAASVLPLDWGPNSIWYAAQWWSESISPGLALLQCDSASVAQVRYEDVVRDAGRELGAACEVLGFGGDLHLGRAGAFIVPAYTAKQHSLVGSARQMNRTESWKTDLSKREVEIFESCAGGLLSALGYQLENEFPMPPTRWELLKMGEWPVIFRQRIGKRMRNYLRKREALSQ
jgi:hypothetical protein